MNAEEGKGLSQINPSVTLTGTAKEGAIGPPVGMVDIGISKYAYLFRVALPGARSKQRKSPILIFFIYRHSPMYTLIMLVNTYKFDHLLVHQVQ